MYDFIKKIITPKIRVSCCDCFYMDLYYDDEKDTTDIFCKLLNRCFKDITDDFPEECPLRTEKYYVELFVE